MRRFFESLYVIIGRQQILAHCQCARFSSERMATYNDPQTWPKHWTATDIEILLRDNLSNPTESPNYESLATLLRLNDIKSLALLVRSFTKSPTPKTVDLEQHLRDNLNNVYDCAAMSLQESAQQLNALDAAHSRQERPLTAGVDKSDIHIKFYEPYTWPKHWGAVEIEALFRKHNVQNPVSPERYQAMALIFQLRSMLALTSILHTFRVGITVDNAVKQHLIHGTDSSDMPLQGRSKHLDELESALSAQADRKKRKVVFSYSQRGSGKTQLIMAFLSTRRAEAVNCGRVIVRCCRKSAGQRSWLDSVLNDAKPLNGRSINADSPPPESSWVKVGLCELIKMHVEDVTHSVQSPRDFSDPETAYATWIRETARHFKIPPDAKHLDPLIILDTCEDLAERQLDHKSHDAEGTPRTMLEAFCGAIPVPFSVVVIGCNANIGSTKTMRISNAKVTHVKALTPLSKKNFRAALAKSWNDHVSPEIFLPLYYWTGGLPRLLRMAHKSSNLNVSLTNGNWNVLRDCFEEYKKNVSQEYRIKTKWFLHAYSCFLASSTKARVRRRDRIPVHPNWKKTKRALTYDEATTQSIGSYNSTTRSFMMPPITFDDAAVRRHRRVMPIMPSQLHPFLNAEVIKHFGKDNDAERGRQFEKPFVYALYARYLLTRWENPKNPSWVALDKVLEGAVHRDQVPILKEYEVNLSRGVKWDAWRRTNEDAAKHAVTYLGGNAKHDAYIWCRKKTSASKTSTVHKTTNCQKKKITNKKAYQGISCAFAVAPRPREKPKPTFETALQNNANFTIR